MSYSSDIECGKHGWISIMGVMKQNYTWEMFHNELNKIFQMLESSIKMQTAMFIKIIANSILK